MFRHNYKKYSNSQTLHTPFQLILTLDPLMVHFYNYLSILNTTVSFVIVLKLCTVCLRKNVASSLASLSGLEPPFQNECESGLLQPVAARQ